MTLPRPSLTTPNLDHVSPQPQKGTTKRGRIDKVSGKNEKKEGASTKDVEAGLPVSDGQLGSRADRESQGGFFSGLKGAIGDKVQVLKDLADLDNFEEQMGGAAHNVFATIEGGFTSLADLDGDSTVTYMDSVYYKLENAIAANKSTLNFRKTYVPSMCHKLCKGFSSLTVVPRSMNRRCQVQSPLEHGRVYVRLHRIGMAPCCSRSPEHELPWF